MVMNADILSFSLKVCAAVKMSAISFKFDNSGSGKLVISGDCLAGGVTSLSSSVNCMYFSPAKTVAKSLSLFTSSYVGSTAILALAYVLPSNNRVNMAMSYISSV